MTSIQIPNRFESILANEQLQPMPLILPVEEDLRHFDRLRRTADVQGGGIVAFLLGDSGVGKTTAVYAASAYLTDSFSTVLPVPHDVPLREVDQWLRVNLPPQEQRTMPVLFDGREVTDDVVGLRQLFSSLNQTLRRRPDLVALWPTTDPEWHGELRSVAEKIGGDSLTPAQADVRIAGPAKDQWRVALERLLLQLDRTLDDLALDEELIQRHADKSPTIGRFLAQIGQEIVSRVNAVQQAKELPQIFFVVTSHSEVVGEANRLRRAETYRLGARELLAYSSRSRAGKWWRARLDTPAQHLGYIISLFGARLATMTPSSVVYACLEFGDEILRQAARSVGATKSSGNADRTFRNTDISHFLLDTTSSELTSTRKGRTSEVMEAAYDMIQELSSRKHKAINQAICQLVDRNVASFRGDLAGFEVNLGEQNLYADVIAPWSDQDLYLEFHHLSGAKCKAASMAAYVMEKLQHYAVHYNLVPR